MRRRARRVLDENPGSPPQLRRGEPRLSRGWGGVGQPIQSLDQHHPGDHLLRLRPVGLALSGRHPSSAEEGSPSANRPLGVIKTKGQYIPPPRAGFVLSPQTVVPQKTGTPSTPADSPRCSLNTGNTDRATP